MQISNHRFGEVFEPLKAEKALHNRILTDLGDAVIVPTLGSVISNWLLMVPRSPALNYRCWYEAKSIDPITLLRKATRRLGIADNNTLWFEHGAAALGSTTGCGVDYAHIHILVEPTFSFHDFFAEVRMLSEKDWKRTDGASAFAELPSKNDYYIFGQGSSVYVGDFDHSLGSQFFRRAVARLVGKDQEWDYKAHPFRANIVETVNNFSAILEDAA